MRLSAKDVSYNKPGSVAAYYGWDESNILPQTQTLLSSGGDKHQANMRKHVDGYLQRNYGVGVDEVLADPNNPRIRWLVPALDYAVREEARKYKTKGGGFMSFLTKLVGPAVGALVLPGVGSALGATISAGAGGAIGGAIQGGISDGPMGAAIGGLTGYGVGSGVGAAKNLLTGAPLSNVNQFMPADVAARAGTTPVGAAGRLAGVMGQNPGSNIGAAAGPAGSVLDRVVNAAPLALAGMSYLDASRQQPASIAPQAASGEAARQAMRDRGLADVDRAFANQDGYYDRLRSSIFDFQTANLDRDYGDQQRELKFELARRGHLGGSQEIDNAAELRRLYNEGRLGAGSVADGAVRQARMADQSARAQAMQDIYMDVDSGEAIGNALNQSRLASEQAADFARGQNLGDVFGRFAYLYSQGRDANERQRAARDFGSRRVSIGQASNYGGSVV